MSKAILIQRVENLVRRMDAITNGVNRMLVIIIKMQPSLNKEKLKILIAKMLRMCEDENEEEDWSINSDDGEDE
jgi:D-Tyr-tRNAtyr deacylase